DRRLPISESRRLAANRLPIPRRSFPLLPGRNRWEGGKLGLSRLNPSAPAAWRSQDPVHLGQELGCPVRRGTRLNVAQRCRHDVGDRANLCLIIVLVAVMVHVLLDRLEEIQREAAKLRLIAVALSSLDHSAQDPPIA